MEDGRYLVHFGVLGMHWGTRRQPQQTGYQSTGIRSALARRSNEKIDKGFVGWKENADKRDNAIALGKKANVAKLAYEKDKSNKALKVEYDKSKKEYKSALKENTTYRKGVVRQEVGKDEARKYLSEAKKVKKELDKDPTNKELQKKYNGLMSSHDVARADARRAVEVGRKRSAKIASLKRARTMAIKGAATTAAIGVGTMAVNEYLKRNGKAGIDASVLQTAINTGKTIFSYAGYMY